MPSFSMTGLKEKIDGIFPLKSFVLSLATLLLSLVIGVGVYQMMFAPHLPSVQLTGKPMTTIDLSHHEIVDEPIKTPAPEEVPKETPKQPPEEHTAEHHNEPAKPLDTAPPDEHAAAEPLKPEPIPEEAIPAPPPVTIPDMIEEVTEKTDFGLLPHVESGGLTSFDAYKAPFVLKPETKGVIALVMVDYGLSDKLSDSAVEKLPSYTNVVASPYASHLQSKISKAHAKLIEVWMILPMQGTANGRALNMGQDAILAGLNSKENLTRLKTHLGRATGYAGVAVTVNPAFAPNAPDLNSIINTISMRGLGVAQLAQNDTVIDKSTSQFGTPFVNGDFWIDDVLTQEAVTQKLADAEKLALSNGLAVVSFYPSQLALNVIAKWYSSLDAQHIQLAPLTYAVKIDGPAAANNAPATSSPAKETTSHGTR